ncbi:hypothetical protein J1605_018573 [Eschrichtius robustus]|uniref:Uncharacterized protein n=1 Tax=Eschrichtius robustus TaxID=9764 RepID=A0AB34HTI4_ESCRO|nr:hypothetical protein J1605_018573 [Eschrichtius robustus]
MSEKAYVFFLRFQGSKGDPGMTGPTGAAGLPVKFLEQFSPLSPFRKMGIIKPVSDELGTGFTRTTRGQRKPGSRRECQSSQDSRAQETRDVLRRQELRRCTGKGDKRHPVDSHATTASSPQVPSNGCARSPASLLKAPQAHVAMPVKSPLLLLTDHQMGIA